MGPKKTIYLELDAAPPETSKQDKDNKSLTLLWQLWNFTPQRHLLFIYWGWVDTEKTIPQRFPKYLLSGLYFLPRGGLLLIHVISLDLSHFAKSAVWVGTDVCEFGRGSFFPSWCCLPVCFQETRLWRICGPIEVSWITNEDANLSSNSKLKIPLNNEWISTSDLILILHVYILCFLCLKVDFEMQGLFDLRSAVITDRRQTFFCNHI